MYSEVIQTADQEAGNKAFTPQLRHDLLTQVNAIIGYSEMLLDELSERGLAASGWRADLDKIRSSGAELFQFLESRNNGSYDFLVELLYFIRTLVTTIVGYADLLLEEADELTPSETRRDLTIIRNAAEKLVSRLQNFVQQGGSEDELAGAFSAVFPLMHSAVYAMQTAKNRQARLRAARLLLADDDVTNLNLLSLELERRGYTVDTAPGGRCALEMISHTHYDLLILDLVMPEVSGLQVLERLHEDGLLIDLPVVVISAWTDIADVTRCIELGAEDFLPRRFNSALLQARIDSILEKKWLREQRQSMLEEKRGAEQEALQASEKKFRQLVNGALVGIFLATREGSVLEANAAMLEMLGYDSVHALNEDGLSHLYVDPEEIDRLTGLLRQSAVRGFETRLRRKSGEIFDASFSAKLLAADEGEWLLEGTLEDITVRRQAEVELRITASVFDNTQEAIMISDADNVIIAVNPAFTRITGYRREEVLGRNPRILSSGRQNEQFYADMWRTLNRTKLWCGEIWNRRKSGEFFAGLLSISAVCDDNGKVLRYVGGFSDISHIKAHEAELAQIAHYDALTGVPNRILLADRMKQALSQCTRDRHMMAVCYLDLDGFKLINDTMGHDVGDLVLIEVARRMGNMIRGGDTVARLGGDEFVLLLLGMEHGDECVATLERILAAIAQPIFVKGKNLSLSASIGVSLFPLDEQDPDTLLRHADQAMYVAKQSGKNRFHIYDPALDKRARDQCELLKNVRHGIEHGQFELYYQPKVNLRTRALVGAEALIRWHHPEHGLLSPAAFLHDIENTALDIVLGEWVMATALEQADAWRMSGLDIELSINISGYHLESPHFAGHLRALLARYPYKLRLQIEVLETVALNDIAIVRGVIESCRELGVGFALDDFGTGYSSLSYLSGLPVDTLKIDQSFVRDMLEDKGDMAIVQGIIVLAQAFGRRTVAEGVESEEHYQALLDMGCEWGQGYGIARPMRADQLASWQS